MTCTAICALRPHTKFCAGMAIPVIQTGLANEGIAKVAADWDGRPVIETRHLNHGCTCDEKEWAGVTHLNTEIARLALALTARGQSFLA